MNAQKTRVLLVEDMPIQARLVAKLLEQAGAGTVTFECIGALAELEEALRRADPHVILLDLSLPDSSGLETLERTVAAAPDVPVIPFTGSDDEAMAIRAVQSGAQDYLVKGEVTGKMLIRSIRYAVERREILMRLSAKERRFREMADLLPDMLYETDSDLRISYANNLAMNTFGFTQADIDEGLLITDLAAPGQGEMIQRDLAAQMVAGGIGIETYNFLGNREDALPCEVHFMILKNASGRATGTRVVMRDITERVKAIEAERLAALGQLAAGVAHEFNNILGAIGGWAQFAGSSGTPEYMEKLLQVVKSGVVRGSEIAKNLMSYAQPTEPHMESVAMEAPLETALAMAVRELENAEIEVVRDFAETDTRMWADPGQIEQVCLNLVINACHAMPDGGTLTVRTALDDTSQETVTTVSDTGTGIEPEALSRIFEPFFTTKGPLGASSVPGTGLGLYVARGIIEAHGGTMSVRSVVGQGTTFEIRLPSTSACECDEDTSSELELSSLSEHPACVLVAEDEEQIRDVLALALRRRGYEILTAADTPQALSLLGERHVDIVLADYTMPGGGGKRLLAELQERAHKVPVVLVTGHIERAVADEARAMGAAECLSKPVDLRELFSTIESVLEESQTAVAEAIVA